MQYTLSEASVTAELEEGTEGGGGADMEIKEEESEDTGEKRDR